MREKQKERECMGKRAKNMERKNERKRIFQHISRERTFGRRSWIKQFCVSIKVLFFFRSSACKILIRLFHLQIIAFATSHEFLLFISQEERSSNFFGQQVDSSIDVIDASIRQREREKEIRIINRHETTVSRID